MKGSEKNSCVLMHLSLFHIGYLSFAIGQLFSIELFEHGWDNLVAGCLIKHIQAQKIQYRPVLGRCEGVFNNTRYFGQGQKFLDLLTSGDLIIELNCI